VTVDDAVFELEDVSKEGDATASPEYVQSLLEKTVGIAGEFGTSFIGLLQVCSLNPKMDI
jgi:hypothetical protein